MLSIPLLRHVKRKWPEQPLILVCRKGLGSFFLKNKLVDEVFELDKKDAVSSENFYSFISSYKIDHLFCPHQSFRSAWMLKSIRANKKITFARWWNKSFFDIRVKRNTDLPEALRVLQLLAPVDTHLAERLEKLRLDKSYYNSSKRSTIASWPHQISTDLSLLVEPDVALVHDVTSKFKLQRPYAVIAPASQWATKRWSSSGFSELVHLLSERALNVYIVGAPSEASYCKEIEHLAAASAGRVDVRSLAGETDLLSLHALLSHAEVVVANDSGPMHMAVAAGRPVVGIFGPTTLDLGFRPWSELSYIAQVDLPCRPCGRHGHNVCPIKTHDCMKKISAHDVIEGVDLLRRKAPVAGSISPSQTY
ncbi:MAG: glycosyltransferase family 9 protein [Bdellovibrionales bacterium]|nr:glycosyltransferase family 9 protein [Bdellovibrionales bacterium]